MKTYLVSYDLHAPGRNYDSLYEKLCGFNGYLHCLESVWFVCSGLSAKGVTDLLRREMDNNDEIIVFAVTDDYWSYLIESKNDWLGKNL